MNYNESICIIEALLFASGEPISLDRLSEASGIEPETVVKLIDRLERKYNVSDSAIRVLRLENSYQLSTREEYAPYIKRAMENKRQARLSPAALEVLAVVAYNQPVTKAFVEQVRGTDSSGVINTLVERELLYEADLNCPADLLHTRQRTTSFAASSLKVWHSCQAFPMKTDS